MELSNIFILGFHFLLIFYVYLAKKRRSSYLVQCFAITKEVQFNEMVVWLPSVRFKWLLNAILLGHWPYPCELVKKYMLPKLASWPRYFRQLILIQFRSKYFHIFLTKLNRIYFNSFDKIFIFSNKNCKILWYKISYFYFSLMLVM